MGGYFKEPLVVGIARGGAVWAMSGFESFIEQDLSFYGPMTDPLPILRRDVEVFIEQPGLYLKNNIELEVNSMPEIDYHVDVWADSSISDGYIYDRVINVIQKNAHNRSGK
jgi:hypothetical protein